MTVDLYLKLKIKYNKMLKYEYLQNNPKNILRNLILKYPDKEWNFYSDCIVDIDVIEKLKDKKWFFPEFSTKDFLPTDIIEKYKEHLDWSVLTDSPCMTIELLEKYIDYIDWDIVLDNPNINVAFIDKYIDKIEFLDQYFHNDLLVLKLLDTKYEKIIPIETISETEGLPEEYIDNNIDKLDWEKLSYHLPVNLLEKYSKYISYEQCSLNYKLTPDFIEKNKDKLNWTYVSKSYNNVIQLEKTCREYISYDQIYIEGNIDNETEDFIERNRDTLNWFSLSCNLNFTDRHIEKWKDKIISRWLTSNPYFTLDMIERYMCRLNLDHILYNPNITLQFLEKHYDVKKSYIPSLYNQFIANDIVYRREINIDIGSRRKILDPISIVDDIKNYILKYYIGYN